MVKMEQAELAVAVRSSCAVPSPHTYSVVDASGELDWSTAKSLRDALFRLDLDRGPSILVDLSRLTFLDSSGMGILVSACRRARASGGTFAVRCGDGLARRSLEVAGLVDFLGCGSVEVELEGNPRETGP